MGSLAYTRLTERNDPPATRHSLAPRGARAGWWGARSCDMSHL